MTGIPEDRYLTLTADLRDLPALPSVLAQAHEWHGRIDGCVYCAGIGGRARLRDTDPAFMAERNV